MKDPIAEDPRYIEHSTSRNHFGSNLKGSMFSISSPYTLPREKLSIIPSSYKRSEPWGAQQNIPKNAVVANTCCGLPTDTYLCLKLAEERILPFLVNLAKYLW